VDIILATRRLTLRQFTEDDAGNLADLNGDPEVMRYITGGRPTPREQLRDEIIPFHLGVYERLDRLGTWAAESRMRDPTPSRAPSTARSSTR
jgi:RimJ/RimL family protein N-acetyltransferase